MIRIRNKIYDVGTFINTDPGGSVIKTKLYTPSNPIDATDYYDQFHARMTKPDKILNSLKVIEVQDGTSTSAELIDYLELYSDLQKSGFFKPSYSHVMYRILSVLFLLFGGIYLLNYNYWLSILVASIGIEQIGWLQHEGGHNSLTANVKYDKLIQKVFFGFIGGLSQKFWNYQHNYHHANTQHEEFDIDLKTIPLIAFDEHVVLEAKKKGLPTKHLRYQYLTWFWLNNAFVYPLWKYFVHPRYEIRRGNYLYPLQIVFHDVVISVGISCLFGLTLFESFIYFNSIINIGLCMLLFNFSVSHTTTGAHNENYNIVSNTLNHTVNINDSFLVNWWMGYLNFQIEHHLFVSMPQFNHPKTSKIIQSYCLKHNLPYVTKTYWEGVYDVFISLKKIGEKC